MENLYWIYEAYTANSFLVGTTVPFAIAAAAYMLRSTASAVFRLIKQTFVVGISFNSTDPSYRLMSRHVYSKCLTGFFQRNVQVHTHDEYNDGLCLASAIGYGNHYGLFNGSPVRVSCHINQSSASSSVQEFTTISILSFRPSRTLASFQKFLSNIVEKGARTNNVPVEKTEEYGNVFLFNKPKRSFDTLRMRETTKEKIKNHLEAFLASQEERSRLGLPWHTGIMIHGKPGTGKSSLVHVIASHLDKGITLHCGGNIADVRFLPKTSVFVIEDIDVTNLSVNRDGATGKNNLSGLLNFLDGPLTPHGMVLMATTNKLDKLDDALVRKGRFDLIVNMDEENEHNL